MPDQYVWLFWSGSLLAVWLIQYALNPEHRRIMLVASLIVMPFGLTQPIFLGEYWSPPGVFDLAARYGLDIECLIFCFAITGINVSLLKSIWGKVILPTTDPVRQPQINRIFWYSLAAPFVLFLSLFYLWPGNPIYWCILAQIGGTLTGFWCFREAIGKLLLTAVPFTAIYIFICLMVTWVAPGYFERIWNLDQLSGVLWFGVPLEEYLFAATASPFMNAIYLHILWNRYGRNPADGPPLAGLDGVRN